MIIIYNVSGLLIGGAGIFGGMLVFGLSETVAPPTVALAGGVLAVAGLWVGLSFAWRHSGDAVGQKRAWPALFFVPLPFAALPLPLVAIAFLSAAAFEGSQGSDSRKVQFQADENELNARAASGDVELSNALLGALQSMAASEAKADRYHIFTRVGNDAVLVLVKAPNLKAYTDSAREELLAMVAAELNSNPQTNGKRAFIGVKGKLVFGALRLPPDRVLTGKALDEQTLYDFYGPKRDSSAKLAGPDEAPRDAAP